MSSAWSRLVITMCACSSLAAVLSCVAIATPNWTVVSIGHSGLWQECYDVIGSYICTSYGISNLPGTDLLINYIDIVLIQ